MSDDTPDEPENPSRRSLLKGAALAGVAATGKLPAPAIPPITAALPALAEQTSVLPSVKEAKEAVKLAQSILKMAQEKAWLDDAARALGVDTLSEKQKELLQAVDVQRVPIYPLYDMENEMQQLTTQLQHTPNTSDIPQFFANTATRFNALAQKLTNVERTTITTFWKRVLNDPEAITLLSTSRVGPSGHYEETLRQETLERARDVLEILGTDRQRSIMSELANKLLPLAQNALSAHAPSILVTNAALRLSHIALHEYTSSEEWKELREIALEQSKGLTFETYKRLVPPEHRAAAERLLQEPSFDEIPCRIEEDAPKNLLAQREQDDTRHYIIKAAPEHRLSAIQFRNMLATHVPEASALGRMGKTKIETVAYTKEKDGEPEVLQHELRIATSDAGVKNHLDHCCIPGTIDLPSLRQSVDCTPTTRGRG